MRADVNLSVREAGSTELGTRTEMKNLNSLKAIARAIEGERERQIECLEAGKPVMQETRRWDDNKEASHAMRSKEDAKDYRYFPDPDLPPVRIPEEWIERLSGEQPELRDARWARYQKEYGLGANDAGLLTEEKALADMFEAVVACGAAPKKAANWLTGETLRLLKEKGMEADELCFTPAHLASLIDLTERRIIQSTAARNVFEAIFDTDADPEEYVTSHGLRAETDAGLIEETVSRILQENPKAAKELAEGKEKVQSYLIGQAMKALKGKADPAEVREAINRLLNKE